MTTDDPEALQRRPQAQGQRRLLAFKSPAQGGSEVVVLTLQPLQPGNELRSLQRRLRLHSDTTTVLRMGLAGDSPFSIGDDGLLSILPNRFQHPERRFLTVFGMLQALE